MKKSSRKKVQMMNNPESVNSMQPVREDIANFKQLKALNSVLCIVQTNKIKLNALTRKECLQMLPNLRSIYKFVP